MKKMRNLLLFLMLMATQLHGLQPGLSDQAEISILNMGPGNQVYSIWGHTAIRIQDPVTGLDKVYNYGTFDFDTPDFVLKFIRGKLDYTLSISHYYNMIAAYGREGRWVQEQVLNFDQAEKNKLYALLEENYKPENRFYKYDFFFDNCATRPVNMIQNSLHEPVQFQALPIAKTFRTILDEHLTNDSWLDFGIDLIIGARADELADPVAQMFMPKYVKDYFSSATIGQHVEKPAVVSQQILLEQSLIPKKDLALPFRPAFVFNFLFGLELFLLFLIIRKKRPLWKMYDQLWFGIISLASLFLLFMWFGTDHLATKDNWNLWWINPLFLLVFFPFKTGARKWIFRFLAGLLILLIAFWTVIPQELNLAFLPLMLILLLKCIRYGFRVYPPETTKTA